MGVKCYNIHSYFNYEINLKNINIGVGSRAKKRRVPLKGVSAAEIDDLRSTNEMPSPEVTDINDELIDDIGASQDEGINLEEELLSRLDNEDSEESQPFNSDISSSIPEKVLEKIASYLEEVTSEDIKSRQPWLDIINKTKPFLGFGLEEASNKINATINPSTVNNDQIKTFDTTFSTALLRLWALLRSELLPSAGPCGFKTDSNNTESYELQGEITKDALNEYLTI